ncbi:hypothetical protein RDABS01_033669 [Bienertia sinuspersici]
MEPDSGISPSQSSTKSVLEYCLM